MFYVGEKFDIAENKSYKTQNGAEKAAEAAGAYVFDDDGNIVFPAVGAAGAAGAAETAETINIIGRATVVFNGKLRVRNAPSFAPETECGLMCKGDTVDVIDTAESDDGKPMWKTVEGNFISADEAHTAFVEV